MTRSLTIFCGAWITSSAFAATPTKPPATPPATTTAPADPPGDNKELKLRKKAARSQKAATISGSGAIAGTVLLEAVFEVNLPKQHSVAAIVGIGSPVTRGQPLFSQLLVDAGAQYRYTLKGDFDTGIWVGAEGTARIRPLQLGGPTDVVVGPMFGFKNTTSFGLTVDLGVGPAIGIATYGPVYPTAIARVQIGYSFGQGPKK